MNHEIAAATAIIANANTSNPSESQRWIVEGGSTTGAMSRRSSPRGSASRFNASSLSKRVTTCMPAMGITMVALMWGKMAKVSLGKDDKFHREKLMCARYWMQRMVPEAPMLLERIQAGSAVVMELE